jgi:hypothetical protein
MPRGVCKIEGLANEDSVVVRYDDGSEVEMRTSIYEDNHYEPPLEQLPPCPPKEEKSDATRT